MKIKYLTGPSAGIVEHVSNETGRVVINAGLAQETTEPVTPIPPAPPSNKPVQDQVIDRFRELYAGEKPAAPVWNCGMAKGPTGVSYPLISLEIGAMKYAFKGHPALLTAKREWEGGFAWLNGFGREVPREYVEEYTRLWNTLGKKDWHYPQTDIPHAKAFAENRDQAEKLALKQKELAQADRELADPTIPPRIPAPTKVIGGPDASEVTYEQSDPARRD